MKSFVQSRLILQKDLMLEQSFPLHGGNCITSGRALELKHCTGYQLF
uniref:Protein VAC14 homolog n=1 Tax=Rhizophora mucronata TaxID=61149 RepID=A0A2P2MT06_RHIMU